MSETIESTQRMVCETLCLERSTLWLFSADDAEMMLTHYWQRPGSPPVRRNFVTTGNLPWADQQVRNGEPIRFSSLTELPPEAAKDREVLFQHGTKSNVTFPLVSNGRVFGALAFATLTAERRWDDEEVSSLQLIAQIFGHVIGKRQAEQRAEQLREEIQRSARAAVLGELAAALAHEINQPLATILANAQAARRFIASGNADPAEILNILDDIIRDDKRAGEVIRNLRAMLSGSPAPHEPACLNELVTEAIAFLGPDLAGQGVELQLDFTSHPLRIRAARVEIQQLLANLISNATQAMSETPAERRRIIIQTSTSGGMVNVWVRDHGCGIPPEHLDRIFEPFHTTRANGLGMGLAICRRIAEAHHGGIQASNDESGGAVFSFWLPPHA